MILGREILWYNSEGCDRGDGKLKEQKSAWLSARWHDEQNVEMQRTKYPARDRNSFEGK